MPEFVDYPAITTLYQAHHGWLKGWLRKRIDCSEQAADLAQDTFVRLLQQRATGRFELRGDQPPA